MHGTAQMEKTIDAQFGLGNNNEYAGRVPAGKRRRCLEILAVERLLDSFEFLSVEKKAQVRSIDRFLLVVYRKLTWTMDVDIERMRAGIKVKIASNAIVSRARPFLNMAGVSFRTVQ